MELGESEVPLVLWLPAGQGQQSTTVRRVKSLGFVRVVYHSGTWNWQAKNKSEGETATAYGKNKPQDD